MTLSNQRIAILAGGGDLPSAVARSASRYGNHVHIIGLRGEASEAIEDHAHSWIKWGEIGRLFKIIENEHCTDLVIIGGVSRPDLSEVRFDLGALKHLPKIFGLTIGGDDTVLSNVIRFFESNGLTVRGAHEVAPDLVAGVGPLGQHKPDERDLQDIARASQLLDALGPHDAGQGTVVTHAHVIAIEAAEGTDAMLLRAASLQQWGRSKKNIKAGILMKKPKLGQDLRVDMPAIGPKTIAGAIEARLSGIAIAAGHVLLAEREQLIKDADAAGLFVVGVEMT